MGTPVQPQGQQLPSTLVGQPNPTPGVAPFTAGSAQAVQQMQQSYAKQMQQQIETKGLDQADLGSAIMHPLEAIGSGAYWLYSNIISHPLTTALIAGQEADVNNKSLFAGSTWTESWDLAKNVSPGQAGYIDARGFFDDAWEKKQLIGQNTDGTLIWDHPQQKQEYFNHGIQQWVSGGMDAATGFYLDPLTLAGKGLKYIKDVGYVKPIVTTENSTFKGALVGSVVNKAAKAVGVSPGGIKDIRAAWSEAGFGLGDTVTKVSKKALASNIDGSNFVKFGDYIQATKDRLGDTFPNWVVNQPWAKQGAMSGVIANAMTAAKDRDELNGVLKAGMGDTNHLAQLSNKNAELAIQLKNANLKIDNLHANQMKYPDINSPAGQQYTNELNDAMADQQAIEDQTNVVKNQLSAQGAGLQKGLYFNNTLTPTLSKMATAANPLYSYAGTGSILYHNLFVRPLRFFNKVGTAWSNVLPNGWIDLKDPNSHREFDAQLRQSGVYTDAERSTAVSNYIAAPYDLKRQVVMSTEAKTLARMAANNGMDEAGAKALYNVFTNGRANSFNSIYSTAELKDAAGNTMGMAHSIDEADGSLIMTHPILKTQLQGNYHPIMDFQKMGKILKLNGKAFQRLVDEGKEYEEAASAAKTGIRPTLLMQRSSDAYNAMADTFNHLWKFNAHVRLGYGLRQMSDDFLGQAARLGAHTIAANATRGLKGQYLRNATWLYDSSGYEAKRLSANSAVDSLRQKLDDAKGVRERVASYPAKGASSKALQKRMLVFHDANVADLDDQLTAARNAQATLEQGHLKLTDKRVTSSNGYTVPGFGEGPEGRMYVDKNGMRNTFNSALGGTAADLLADFRNEYSAKAYLGSDPDHIKAWLNSVQKQIQNDPAAMMAVRGKTNDEIAAWLRGNGSQYYKDVATNLTGTGGRIYNWNADELADRISAHVNHYLPGTTANFQSLRSIVAANGNDEDVLNAMKATERNLRPTVHGADYGIATGQSSGMQKIDKIISSYYKWTAEQPANILSRNPLAATLYRSHVKEAFAMAEAQGKTHFTNDELDKIASISRANATRDVKKFTYNMDFETKVQHAMRFVSPFFGAGQEAVNRWGRILADRPSVLGNMATIYSAPMRIGKTYTYNGVPIVDGYSIDPSTGKKYLVPMDQTMIRFQLPSVMAKAMNAVSEIASFKKPTWSNPYGPDAVAEIPLSSLNLAFRNDPWFNPGEGPIVEMAANKFALSEPPSVGDFLTKMGILPTGIQQSSMSELYGSVLSSIQASNSDGSVAATTLQAMQDLNYQWEQGLLSKQPTWTDAVNRGQQMAAMKAWFKGTSFLPFSMDFQDPYQFFRDQYNTITAANPNTADQVFYAKYGDSAYAFTASLNKNNIPGIPATNAGQELAKQFAPLIEENPSLAGVIIGSQGAGPYSQSAYEQQIFSGQRTKQTPQEAWTQMETNLGWDQYSSFMNGLNAQLFNRGLTTYNDKGAEDLLAQKQAFVKVLSSATMPDGVTANNFYNASWTAAYDDYDPSKQNANALALNDIASAKELQGRPDIQGLQAYLSIRATVQGALAERSGAEYPPTLKKALNSGSGDINAKSNEDLKSYFQQSVMGIIQSNTAFQTLYDKYLTGDLFDVYDGTNVPNPNEVATAAALSS